MPDMKTSNSDNKQICPLCCEKFDEDDMHFYPCPCSYQICLFCWNRIINDDDGRCPACRMTYNKNLENSSKGCGSKGRRKKAKKKKSDAKSPTEKRSANLANFRIIQENMIYIRNIPLNTSKVPTLKSFDYFGAYGRVERICIVKNEKFLPDSENNFKPLTLYVTFTQTGDAVKALCELRRMKMKGVDMIVTFGCNKYCDSYINNEQCKKQHCHYIHSTMDKNVTLQQCADVGSKMPKVLHDILRQYGHSETCTHITKVPAFQSIIISIPRMMKLNIMTMENIKLRESPDYFSNDVTDTTFTDEINNELFNLDFDPVSVATCGLQDEILKEKNIMNSFIQQSDHHVHNSFIESRHPKCSCRKPPPTWDYVPYGSPPCYSTICREDADNQILNTDILDKHKDLKVEEINLPKKDKVLKVSIKNKVLISDTSESDAEKSESSFNSKTSSSSIQETANQPLQMTTHVIVVPQLYHSILMVPVVVQGAWQPTSLVPAKRN